MRSLTLARIALMAVISAPVSLWALEGGQRSTDPEWRSVAAPATPSDSQRAAELTARSEAMQADLERLRARLERVPSAPLVEQLHARLREIHDAYGWAPQTQMVYGRRSMDPILRDQAELPPRLLQAFVQLQNDLAARGVDLIIVPLAPNPFFDSHRLVDGIGPEHEIYPGWTRMMIQMLEHDLEIVDTIDEFRAAAENPVLVSWVNDYHTGSTGRAIAARALAERLQRYDFARELAGNRDLWTEEIKTRTGAMWPQRITVTNGMFRSMNTDRIPEDMPRWHAKHPRKSMVLQAGAPNLEAELAAREFQYLNLKRTSGLDADALRRNEIVFFGDSQLHSAVYGSGLPEFYMREIGGLFRWGSKSWSGFSPPDIYQEVVPDGATQPRVAVLSFLPKYFWQEIDRRSGEPRPSKYGPRPMPAFGAASAAPALSGPTEVRVRVRAVSDKRDPADLDYDDALTQTAVEVIDGPLQGETIALRYWAMADGAWLERIDRVRRGQTIEVTVIPWRQAIEGERGLAEHMIFDETNLPNGTPTWWVSAGALALDQLQR